MRIVLLRCLAWEKYFEKDLLIPLMCRKWGTELTPSIPAKGPDFLQGELDTAQLSFPKTTHHFRNAWLWGLSQKLFLTHPKIISSLPERLWSQNINLSFFISVSTEFSPAPREEAIGFCCKLLCSSHSLHTSKCFCKKRKASSPPGWLLKESRRMYSSS